MAEVKVLIADGDRYVGAMVRGLAHIVGGPGVVKGLSSKALLESGFYVLHFANNDDASKFTSVMTRYLPPALARVVE